MDLVAQNGTRYELAEARCFHHEWEGPASLRLRDGDQTVLRDYHSRPAPRGRHPRGSRRSLRLVLEAYSHPISIVTGGRTFTQAACARPPRRRTHSQDDCARRAAALEAWRTEGDSDA